MPTAEQPKKDNEAQNGDVAEELAKLDLKVRKLQGKSGLFKVWSTKGTVSFMVDLNAQTCSCSYFAHSGAKCKHIEAVENIDKMRLQKWKDYRKRWGVENREKINGYNEERREELERFKKECGGKCVVCEEDNISILIPHHLGKREDKRGVAFINSKEFRNWLKYGIKPDVSLFCPNHHSKLHIMEAREEIPYKCRDLDYLRKVLL